jgi:hypothetical protein
MQKNPITQFVALHIVFLGRPRRLPELEPRVGTIDSLPTLFAGAGALAGTSLSLTSLSLSESDRSTALPLPLTDLKLDAGAEKVVVVVVFVVPPLSFEVVPTILTFLPIMSGRASRELVACGGPVRMGSGDSSVKGGSSSKGSSASGRSPRKPSIGSF